MLTLFRFLWRYYPFFLFLILETIALRMLLSSSYQSGVANSMFDSLSGAYFQEKSNIQAYFYLRQDNEALALENNTLKMQIQELQAVNAPVSHFMLSDSFLVFNYVDSIEVVDTSRKYFEFMPCEVINNQTLKAHNFLMLNKGREDGVQSKMGVINAQGVVGIVSQVSAHFSTAVSLLNTEVQFSALIQPSGELCSLHWNAENAQTAELLHLEPSAQIAVGDAVVTSGYSHTFPKGIQLGTVSNILNQPDNFKVSVKLSVDFSRLHYLNVLSNPYKEELQHLTEGEVEN